MHLSTHNRNLFLLLALYFLILLLPTGFVSLFESTEGRFGEIAWEMVQRGNYLEPYFNGIKHFHKPPLTYWLIAAGYQLFGVNDFGARFFGVVATCLALVYLYRLALLLLGDEKKALNAALIFASSLLLLAVSRIVATDIYLACFTVMAQFYLFRQLYGERGRRNTLLYALALGLGFLTKGPIIFLFTLLPYLVAKIFDPDHRRVFRTGDILAGGALFCLLALPWYLAVIAKNPGLLEYFLKVQTVDRVATDRFRRSKPFWYFFYIFFATFAPYIFFFLAGLFRVKELPRRLRILFLYIGVPLLVFTLAKSKQPTYILPFFGIAAILTAELLGRWPLPRLRDAAAALLTLVAAAPTVAAFVYPPLRDHRLALTLVLVPALWLAWQAVRERRGERFLRWCAALLLLFATAGHAVLAIAAPSMRGYQQLVARINELDPQRREDILIYHAFLPSVSLYRGKLAVIAFGMERETLFQDDDAHKAVYLATDAEVTGFVAARRQFFLVGQPDELGGFFDNQPVHCDEIYSQRKATAYLCQTAARPLP